MAVRNLRILRIVSFMILVCLFSFAAEAKYGGGSGIASDPYQIATAEDLMLLGESSEDYDRHFILTADINLDPNLPGRRVFDKAVIGDYVFAGVFDGNGHIIANMTIRGGDELGLFGSAGAEAEIRDLGVVNVDIVGSGDSVGGLAGEFWGKRVINCYSTGAVSGNEDVGGLVGFMDIFSRITCSYAACTVSGEDSVGGLVGSSNNVIAHCYARGSVEGNTKVGGLVGTNDYGAIRNCYAVGIVTGTADVGGLVGLIGHGGTDPIPSSFWDIQASRQTTSARGMGKTTAEMQDPNMFMDAGWDFVGAPDGPHDIWIEPAGGGYPILWWQLSPTPSLPAFSGGTGEPDDPFLISTATGLNSIGYNPRLMGTHFKLMNDIDLEGINFYIVGSYVFRFTGVFDGNGFIISNLKYNSEESYDAGLFRYVSGPGEIKDLGLSDPNIDGGSGSDIGSLIGHLNRGKVTGCHVNGGSVKGRISVGGLIGSSLLGEITNCYSSATVSGERMIGGLVGEDRMGTISGCYLSNVISSGEASIGGLAGYISTSTIINSYLEGGAVSGDKSVGGFVGFSTEGTVANCYSTGSVTGNENVGGLIGEGGFAHNSFWDIQTSGHSTSAGGKGRTTDQMRMASTYVGWNGCGDEGVWTIDEGNDYPRLSWENRPGEVLETQQLSDFLNGTGTIRGPYLIYTAEELNMIGLFPCEWDRHFKLMADIDLSQYTGTEFNVIGIPDFGGDYVGIPSPFSGVFDGNEKKITNFSHAGGLFLYVTGSIRDLGLIDANINAASGFRTGSLVGDLFEGTVTNCYAEGGSVSGGFSNGAGGLLGNNTRGTVAKCYATNNVLNSGIAGGLVGMNSGDLTECYTAGFVSGDSDVGGLAGRNSGEITNCYAAGSVLGTDDYSSSVGGLVGMNWGEITNCYSSGSVLGEDIVGGLVGENRSNDGIVSTSFWDVETSDVLNMCGDQNTCDDSFGKTTTEMQTAGMFLDAGWDFVDETTNGEEDIWWINEGQDYPKLWWEPLND